MPLQATSGAASQDAFGGNGAAVIPYYIEDMFSTYLYAGTSAAGNVITNNIDLSTNGGLLWIKDRTSANTHNLFDNTRNSFLNELNSASTLGSNAGGYMSSVSTTGFTPTSNNGIGGINRSGENYASWTFRKQPKFFDVVTFTAGTSSNRRISHSLGSAPGMILLKANESRNWYVYHRSLGRGAGAYLNLTNAAFTSANTWGTSDPTSTDFGFDEAGWATSGVTQTAYLFAHDAGGFGLTGTDNVISCGSYTCVAYPGDVAVTLGYEPQWVMVKNATQASNWVIYDNMRGMPATSLPNPVTLAPDSSAAENGVTGDAPGISPTATGFIARAGLTAVSGSAGDKVIYIAIRRGPMKVPTTGTSVFAPLARTGTGTTAVVTGVGFAPDMYIATPRTGANVYQGVVDKLRGKTQGLVTSITAAETTASVGDTTAFGNDGISLGVPDQLNMNLNGQAIINWFFRRAPSFFDEVCYTGTGSTRTVSHNLAAVPQLIITKVRSSAGYGWFVYPLDPTKYMELNSTSGTGVTSSAWNDTAPTASVFTVGPADQTNLSGATMVAYLFATCAGVSKVGSYTGTGTTLQIDCGFTAGARFVLIKRTDSTGGWYVWDTARGIIAGNDPYLLLNSTAAEVTSTDYIDTYSAGFEISSTAPAAINANGGSFIFFAVS